MKFLALLPLFTQLDSCTTAFTTCAGVHTMAVNHCTSKGATDSELAGYVLVAGAPASSSWHPVVHADDKVVPIDEVIYRHDLLTERCVDCECVHLGDL